jgi:hypothetical protein
VKEVEEKEEEEEKEGEEKEEEEAIFLDQKLLSLTVAVS